MFTLFLYSVWAAEDTEQCIPMATKLKQTLMKLPYRNAEALYVRDQCGYNMSYECMEKERARLMSFPKHTLLTHNPRHFCQKLSDSNLHGRSNSCNWCLSSATLLQKWQRKMEPKKYADFASDYCYACGRYHQRDRCRQIRNSVNSHAGQSPEAVCAAVGHCKNGQ